MKYLYLDCFAGFDPLMLLGALIDMGQSSEKLQKSFLPGVTLSFSQEKRMGMEAVLAKADSKYPSKPGNTKAIEEMARCFEDEPERCSLLAKYISIRSSALSLDAEKAIFDTKDESVNLSVLSAAFDAISGLGIEKIYVSTVFASSGVGLFDSYTKEDTLYISKKYGIKTRPANEECEIFPASGGAFLAAFGAESVESFLPGGVIKIGYGAGEAKLSSLPNILRVVMGEENQGDFLVSEEASLSESIFANMATAGMKER